jgi:hypothetical protein
MIPFWLEEEDWYQKVHLFPFKLYLLVSESVKKAMNEETYVSTYFFICFLMNVDRVASTISLALFPSSALFGLVFHYRLPFLHLYCV